MSDLRVIENARHLRPGDVVRHQGTGVHVWLLDPTEDGWRGRGDNVEREFTFAMLEDPSPWRLVMPEMIDAGPPVTVECMPGVIVRPGDVLILECGPITVAQAQAIKAAAMEKLPGLADVVVMGGGHIGGVYRDSSIDVATPLDPEARVEP